MTRSISHSKTATAVLLLAAVGWFGLLSAPESPVGLFETLQENISSGTRNVSLYLRRKNAHGVENNNLASSQSSLITDSLHYSNSKRRRLTSQEEEDKFVLKSRKEHFPLFEAGDTFSVIGPSIFPKPTYIYEVVEDNNKIEDSEIVTYLQPTSGQHRPEKDSVLVFAAEYGFQTYMLFFMTLYQTGFKGDVVVGISRMDWEKKEIRDFLEYWKNEDGKDEMTVVVYVVPYHCYNLEGEILESHKGGMRVCQCHNMFGRKDKQTGETKPLLDQRHGRTAQTIRYELYWIWSEHYNPNSWMLLIDARDTIFQETPFGRVPRSSEEDVKSQGGTLIFFGENADATSLGKSKYNRRWLSLAYGDGVADAFYNKPTICSGSTMGEQASIESYLRAEVAESDESKTVIFGADQGFHNYLYYSNKMANSFAISKILVQDQGLGIVNNMGALRDKELSEWGNGKMVEKTDTAITIHNWDGTISPVVHQYDRHKPLSTWWHDHKYAEFKTQWNTMKEM